jgi:signal peptidase I
MEIHSDKTPPPGSPDRPARSQQRNPASTTSPRRILLALLFAIVIAALLRIFVLHAYRIPSASMENTLLVGDFLIAERISFGSTVEFPWSRQTDSRLPAVSTPLRGEVVIFRSWDDNRTEFIKRVVALAGDTVEVVDNLLLVNSEPFDQNLIQTNGGENHVRYLTREQPDYPLWHHTDRLRNFGPHVVPSGHFFAMGDNRDNSDDSRVKGDVPYTSLRGRPVLIYWSSETSQPWWNPIHRVRWSRIGRLIR